MAATLEGLERDGLVRPATAADAVDGVAAELVAEPASVREAGELLRAASRAGLRMAVAGGGSKLGLGNPPERLDLLVSTRRLDRVLEHAAGDLVVKVEAGAHLADLQAALDAFQAGDLPAAIEVAIEQGRRLLPIGEEMERLLEAHDTSTPEPLPRSTNTTSPCPIS